MNRRYQRFFKKAAILSLCILSFAAVSSSASASGPSYPNGFFVEGGGGYEYLRARSLDLSPPSQPGKLADSTTSTEGAGFFGKVGYQLGVIPLSIELEFFKYSRLPYNEDPLILTNLLLGESMRSDIKGYAGFLDARYFFNLGTDYFLPYVLLGAGMAHNEVDMKSTDYSTGIASSADKKLNGFAWQAGLGLRIKVVDNVFFDLTGRYAQLGRAQWGPWGENQKKITTNTIEAAEALISIVVFFGNQHGQSAPSLINDK